MDFIFYFFYWISVTSRIKSFIIEYKQNIKDNFWWRDDLFSLLSLFAALTGMSHERLGVLNHRKRDWLVDVFTRKHQSSVILTMFKGKQWWSAFSLHKGTNADSSYMSWRHHAIITFQTRMIWMTYVLMTIQWINLHVHQTLFNILTSLYHTEKYTDRKRILINTKNSKVNSI